MLVVDGQVVVKNSCGWNYKFIGCVSHATIKET